MEPVKKRMQTCCFTGHRQIPPQERENIAEKLESVIVSLYQRGVRYYGAGGALGFDTVAAQTVIHLRESCPGMKLILVLPCLTQTRGWGSGDVAEYNSLGGGWTDIQTKAEHEFFSESASVYLQAYREARAEMKSSQPAPPVETAVDIRA